MKGNLPKTPNRKLPSKRQRTPKKSKLEATAETPEDRHPPLKPEHANVPKEENTQTEAPKGEVPKEKEFSRQRVIFEDISFVHLNEDETNEPSSEEIYAKPLPPKPQEQKKVKEFEPPKKPLPKPQDQNLKSNDQNLKPPEQNKATTTPAVALHTKPSQAIKPNLSIPLKPLIQKPSDLKQAKLAPNQPKSLLNDTPMKKPQPTYPIPDVAHLKKTLKTPNLKSTQ